MFAAGKLGRDRRRRRDLKAVRRWGHVYGNRRFMPSMLRISLVARLRALPHPLVLKIQGWTRKPSPAGALVFV